MWQQETVVLSAIAYYQYGILIVLVCLCSTKASCWRTTNRSMKLKLSRKTLLRWLRSTNSGGMQLPGAMASDTGGDHQPLMPSHSSWRWPRHSTHRPWRPPLQGCLTASRQIQWQALSRQRLSRLHGHPSRYGRRCQSVPFNICSLLHLMLFADSYLLA